MARFYGSMKGNRGEVTRCGSLNSGITAHVRGWNVGIQAEVHKDFGGDFHKDICEVFITTGSGGDGTRKHVLTVNADGSINYEELGILADVVKEERE